MKLAILGSTPIALEAALRFHDHGASLTWFCEGEEDLFTIFSSSTPDGYTSDLGLQTLAQLGLGSKIQNWFHDYYRPLRSFLSTTQVVKAHEVISVTKRFLGREEEISGKSRFYDLFRVIFLVNPQQFIEEQKEIDPAKYEKLSSELVGSLQSTIEMYEDFDVVLDLRGSFEVSSLAASGRALGEKRISREKVLWGLDILKNSETIKNDNEAREIALVGSHALAAEALIHLESWLQDPRSRMFLVTTEEEPFSAFLKEATATTREKLMSVLKGAEERLEKDYDEFHRKLRDWQELDDFVQVKIPRPAEPIPQLNFFSGHNVTAIDELIDRRRLFLTLEKPDFREGKKHPENNRVDLKTIGVDRVLAANGGEKKSISPSLRREEKGFFILQDYFPTIEDAWKKECEQLKGIENEIFKLFSPASPH